MKKPSRFVCFTLLLSLFFPILLSGEASESSLFRVNKKVEALEKSIADDEYPFFTFINDMGATDFVPPEMKFYYEPDSERLVATLITAGHECWSKTFSYYFDKDGNILKYLEVIDRPDNPPRRAVIYGSGGSILWKNMEAPGAGPSEIKEFFREAMAYQHLFSRY